MLADGRMEMNLHSFLFSLYSGPLNDENKSKVKQTLTHFVHTLTPIYPWVIYLALRGTPKTGHPILNDKEKQEGGLPFSLAFLPVANAHKMLLFRATPINFH